MEVMWEKIALVIIAIYMYRSLCQRVSVVPSLQSLQKTMSRLTNLKIATSIHDLAQILGYSAKGLAYVVHGVPDAAKYTDFPIKKRSGGMRMISAPIPEL